MTTSGMNLPANADSGPDPSAESERGLDGDAAPAAAPAGNWRIRFYRREDRPVVRRICADTGFLGSPIDPLFEDRELFADYLTQYYTDREPESTLVCELDGEVMGYLMGSRRRRAYAFYRLWHNAVLVTTGMWRYFFRPYNAATRKYVHWLLTKATAESPKSPAGLPHFHINQLPKARNVAQTRALIDRFLEYLTAQGETGVYGQMVTFDSRRGTRMFERYGFRVIDKAEVTKYQHLREGQVFLFTVVKDLTAGTRLYGNDLARAAKTPEAP